MPRTRSAIARAAPKPHKLPTDILTRVAAFARDDELARLALSAKSALAALDNQQIWAATLRTNHGGLVIRAEPSGLKAAARLAEARKHKGPVYGCHALMLGLTTAMRIGPTPCSSPSPTGCFTRPLLEVSASSVPLRF